MTLPLPRGFSAGLAVKRQESVFGSFPEIFCHRPFDKRMKVDVAVPNQLEDDEIELASFGLGQFGVASEAFGNSLFLIS